MAKPASVWGIEIGQSALKALRCSLSGDQVVAEAFDYIEYPKILSQPDSDPETMVREALDTFVKRNDLKKTRVALNVSGSNGLAKFFKPPPVELKKLPDIVKYEARQQIPFDLNDVIWDYQLMAGGDISDGFALECEVGLFAMKRDSVFRALKPLDAVKVEIDLLQLAPLSIFNMVTFDKSLADDPEFQYDPEHPPKSTVVLAMGTDSTDLIVTNGYRVWQRSMPLGGNHFTRQLTKDLKLTFAKAEHLKRNAMEADDPKLIFQAMRPVFNDLVTEVQRSMGFFRSLNKQAEIGSILMLGNSVKLPGLSQYLSKNLAMDVEVLEHFNLLTGDEVVSAPAFRDHVASFAPVYGLCLQALGKGPAATNLIPKEIVSERLIRSKKPWAVAAAATLLLGFAGNLLFAGSRYGYIHPDKWSSAMSAAETTKKQSDDLISEDKAQLNTVEVLTQIGSDVSGSADRRLLWLEITHALFAALSRPQDVDMTNLPDPKDVPYNQRPELFITKIDCKHFNDISTYLTPQVLKAYGEDNVTWRGRVGLLDDSALDDQAAESADVAAEATSGDDAAYAASDSGYGGEAAGGGEAVPGGFTAEMLAPAPDEGEEEGNKAWVIQIDGYHYHNGKEYAQTGDEQEEYVLKTLVQQLENGSVVLPIGNGQTMEFTFKEMGLSAPFVVKGTYLKDNKIPNPEYRKKYGSTGGTFGGYGAGGYGGDGGYGGGGYGGGGAPGAGGMGGMGAGMGFGGGGDGGSFGGGLGGPGGQRRDGEEEIPRAFDAPKYNFSLQVIWKERPLSQRIEAKKQAEAEAEAAAEEEENLAGI